MVPVEAPSMLPYIRFRSARTMSENEMCLVHGVHCVLDAGSRTACPRADQAIVDKVAIFAITDIFKAGREHAVEGSADCAYRKYSAVPAWSGAVRESGVGGVTHRFRLCL